MNVIDTLYREVKMKEHVGLNHDKETPHDIPEYNKYIVETNTLNGKMFCCYLCHADSFDRNKMLMHVETDHIKTVLCKYCKQEVGLIDMKDHIANNHDTEELKDSTDNVVSLTSNTALIKYTKTGKGYTRVMDRNNGRYTVVLYSFCNYNRTLILGQNSKRELPILALFALFSTF